jgi:hypothetical protein
VESEKSASQDTGESGVFAPERSISATFPNRLARVSSHLAPVIERQYSRRWKCKGRLASRTGPCDGADNG